MARDTNLFGAFIDGRRPGELTRVAGVPLRPFSVWHLFQLQALDSPFLRQGTVTRLDLLRALAVCRTGFPDSRLRLPVWRTLWPLRHGIERAVAEFLAYAGSYLYKPDYAVVVPTGGGPREQITPAPETMRLVWDVMGSSRSPAAEAWAWDLPVGRAHWYQVGGLRERGANLSYMDDEEREFQEQMRAAEAEKAEVSSEQSAVSSGEQPEGHAGCTIVDCAICRALGGQG